MDFPKFNKLLSDKITKAKLFEKHKNIDDAIALWLEISQLTLNQSKSPGLEFKFKNMLLNKTEQIIAHVKELKSPKATQIPIYNLEQTEKAISLEEMPKFEKEPDDDFENTMISIEKEKEKLKKDIKLVNNSEFKNLPDGFKEIQPSNDFKILVPHDPNYINNLPNEADIDMSIFKKKEEPSSEENFLISSTKIDLTEEEGKTLCSLCGSELDEEGKICKNCGSEL